MFLKVWALSQAGVLALEKGEVASRGLGRGWSVESSFGSTVSLGYPGWANSVAWGATITLAYKDGVPRLWAGMASVVSSLL